MAIHKGLTGVLIGLISMIMLSCGEDDPAPPPEENDEKVITDVILIFETITGGTQTDFSAQDPDGEGPEGLMAQDTITLRPNVPYKMFILLSNSTEGENITDQVEAEGDDHMFFFEWTEGLFPDPGGNGNTDSRTDLVNYDDLDINGLPLGLETFWVTTDTPLSGTFRLVLKYQPTFKSATSTVTTERTDLDITFPIRIQ
ncbi:MAG: hypothetical protein AAF694_07935 [Bacteroidota bacterium]